MKPHLLRLCLFLSLFAVAACDTSVGESEPSATALAVESDASATDCFGSLCVFPGAQGFGTDTPAGRGGQILRVTTLEDSGPGSLRAALEASGPRVVVFEVSGTILVDSKLNVDEPYLTIAGQTAPSPGIQLRGTPAFTSTGSGLLNIRTHDVLVQHLRIRPGDEGGTEPDALSILNEGTYNVVVDHTSMSWGIDENVSTWAPVGGPSDITFSNSIISEALHNSFHVEGPHSKGVLINDETGRFSMIGNVLAHNEDRNPFIKGGAGALVVNNVFYNWGNKHATRLGSFGSREAGAIAATVVGNLYRAGPSTDTDSYAIRVKDAAEGTRLYHHDNLSDVALFLNETPFDVEVGTPPVWIDGLRVLAAAEVEEAALSRAGAWPTARDGVDRRVLDEVRQGGGRIIDSQSEVGGWSDLPVQRRAFEAPADPNGDDDNDGYTNLEEVLHEMARVAEGGAPAGGGDLSLSADGYKVRGRWNTDLSWSGATSSSVDVYRNGSLVVTTANDGAYTDATDSRGGGSLTYTVCEAGTTTCSNQATASF